MVHQKLGGHRCRWREELPDAPNACWILRSNNLSILEQAMTFTGSTRKPSAMFAWSMQTLSSQNVAAKRNHCAHWCSPPKSFQQHWKLKRELPKCAHRPYQAPPKVALLRCAKQIDTSAANQARTKWSKITRWLVHIQHGQSYSRIKNRDEAACTQWLLHMVLWPLSWKEHSLRWLKTEATKGPGADPPTSTMEQVMYLQE